MKNYKTVQIDGKQIRLHRYLMEAHLKRKLSSNELVHHINGDKHDNRLENLKIVTRSEHLRLHPEINEKSLLKRSIRLDIDEIKKLYKSKTITEIASIYDVSPMTIWYRMKKAKIQTTKLNKEDVLEIRELLNDNVPNVEIAKKYNVSTSTITDIKKNRRYKKW